MKHSYLLIFVLLIVCSSFDTVLAQTYVQTITKETIGSIDKTVCPTLPHIYRVNIPSTFGACKILWTVANGEIIGGATREDVSVAWNDTPGATGTLTVTFQNCGQGNSNEGLSTSKSELILSVKNQSWGSYTNNFNVDFCNPAVVNLSVPQMFVQGTGGAGQPSLQEVLYSWTIPAGWVDAFTGTGGLI